MNMHIGNHINWGNDMMRNKRMASVMAGALSLSIMAGCTGQGTIDNTVKLDPNNPVSLTLWHYYNGAQQAAFDELVEEFNATTGKEMGIYVEGYSQGSVSDLKKAVSDAVAEKVGAQEMPDIFSTYADTAYAVQQQGMLADLSAYFTQDELDEYVDGYIQEGYFLDNEELYLFPVAKSTEIMMLNVTDWQPFAEATGTTVDELSTVEGVVKVAEKYYAWTDAQTPDVADDGKAFYGRDSLSNYFIISMKQMGIDLFDVKDGKVTIRADRQQIRRLWDNYYVPYIKGYFTGLGKFRSDDVKTGDILCYTGSTSSSMYFPDEVVSAEENRAIDYQVLMAPVMEGCDRVNVQQGAGMAVTRSDEIHEYAASQFLKWFTAKENNLRFVCESSYLPVRKDANSTDALDQVIENNDLRVNQKAYDCLATILNQEGDITFYTTKCFDNGYSTRKILDFSLSDQATEDRAAVEELIASGITRDEAVAPYLSDDAFDTWYDGFVEALTQAAGA